MSPEMRQYRAVAIALALALALTLATFAAIAAPSTKIPHVNSGEHHVSLA
jgi:hypothetical protein